MGGTLNIPSGDDLGQAWGADPNSRKRLLQMVMGSDPSATMDPPSTDRIADDSTRHPNSDAGSAADLESRASGAPQRLAAQVQAQANPQPSRVDQMQSQYDAMQAPQQQPVSLKKRIALTALAALAGHGGQELATSIGQRRQQNQQFEEGRYDRNRASLLGQIEAERRMQEQNSREDERDTVAYARQLEAQRGQDFRNPPHTLETGQGVMQWDPNTRSWSPMMMNGQPVTGKAQPKPDTPEQQFFDSPEEAGKPLKDKVSDYAAASQKPEQPQRPQQMLGVIDGKVVELKPGMSVPEGTQSLSGDLRGSKPTADEQRRADLAENLNENLSTLEEIATRRPDLFGPLAGRLTGLRGWAGSNDPDIGTLETIKHQIGMAQISAHGMRSAQGVSAAAESILNSFKNGPDAVKASVAAARNSVKTFTNDVQRTKSGAGNSSLKGKMALSEDEARLYLQKAGGDKDKARKLAKADGRTF